MDTEVSADFILKLTGKKDLKEICSLSLKNLNLTKLDGRLFTKMTSLVTLDLSGNNLREIPASMVHPGLLKLDICDNQLTSTMFVTQFSKLQELYLEGNPLEPSDRYIAHLLCPSLLCVDRMKSDTVARMAHKMKTRLTPQIQEVWDAKFLPRFPDGIPVTELDAVNEEFLSVLKHSSLNSPTPFKKYTECMVELLAQELVDDLSTPAYQWNKRSRERVDYKVLNSFQNPSSSTDSPQHNKSANSPNKKTMTPTRQSPIKRPASGPSDSPTKRSVTFNQQSPSTRSSASPKKPTTPSRHASPTKRLSTPSKCPSPTKKLVSPVRSPTKRGTQTPFKKTPSKTTPKSKTPDKSLSSVLQLPQVADYDPVHFVRCHYGGSSEHGDNDPTDNATQVWKCEFEPDPQHPGKTTNVVATCGGHIVCLLDCNTGRVLKRFKHDTQHFYTLGWTTVVMKHEGRDWSTNILVVAGVQGHVKLIHPEQMVCYAEFQAGCLKYISWLLFHPDKPTILFCGDSNGGISVWDIGLPEGSMYKTQVKQLTVLDCHKSPVTCLVWSKPTGHLLAGTEDGLYAWHASTPRIAKLPRLPEKQLNFFKDEKHVDGLCLVAEDIAAIKVLEQGCIWLWRLSTHLKSSKSSIKISPLAVLDYLKTSSCYLSISSMAGVLVTGDDLGNIHMYDVSTLVKTSIFHSEKKLRASRVLVWPECVIKGKRQFEEVMIDLLDPVEEILVNSVAVNHNRQYIVATADNNMVCIWKKAS